MKPSRAQMFFASPWPERIWFTAIPVIVAVGVGRSAATFMDPLSGLWEFLRFAGYVGIGWLLGFFLAMFPGSLILGPIYYDRELKNGGPFQVGDCVQILWGPHRGRTARIYSTWQGSTLRVELGAEERQRFKDIFAPVQLLRAERSDPDAGDPTDAEV